MKKVYLVVSYPYYDDYRHPEIVTKTKKRADKWIRSQNKKIYYNHDGVNQGNYHDDEKRRGYKICEIDFLA